MNKNIELRSHVDPVQIRAPLSFGQERLWFIDQLQGSTDYHIFEVLRIRGALNKSALEEAIHGILERHEVLRTVIAHVQGESSQVIRDGKGWELKTSRFDGARSALCEHLYNIIYVPFDLSKDYMVRAELVVVGEEEHLLVITIHHIACDGWSAGIFMQELTEFYNARVERRSHRLKDLSRQYTDYARWQRELQEALVEKSLAYWESKLRDVPLVKFPADMRSTAVIAGKDHGAVGRVAIDAGTSEALLRFSREQGSTLFMTLLAAFHVLLARYTGQYDLCVGAPIANRSKGDIQGLIGLFVNTIALRSNLSNNPSFTDVLQQIRQTVLEAHRHSDVPFERVVQAVKKERLLSGNPLFEICFTLDYQREEDSLNLFSGLTVASEAIETRSASFELNVMVEQSSAGLSVRVDYRRDLFTATTIDRMLKNYRQLLISLSTNPSAGILDVTMLDPAEENLILQKFNHALTVNQPEASTVLTLFAAQVAKNGDRAALEFDGQPLSYDALDRRSNQLAAYLKRQGVCAGALIPICVERGVDMIVGILGILKAGAAYVPIDPKYPAERIASLIEDTRADLLIHTTATRDCLPALHEIRLIELDVARSAIGAEANGPISPVAPDTPAYIIYTSGSTGKPKGVLISHGAIAASTLARCRYYKTVGRMLLIPHYSFDSSVAVIFGTLAMGGTLVLCREEELKTVDKIAPLVRTANTILCVPSYYNFLLEEGLVADADVSTVIVAGEALRESLVRRHADLLGAVALYNEYGPTECAVWATVGRMTPDVPVTIGKPIDTVRLYILDENQNLLPIGAVGEIYLSGSQLFQGYLHDDGLTKTKIVHNPYGACAAETLMYRTGDFGRWLQDGTIAYQGRVDDQVKINGFRIELAEIERVLMQSETVCEAVVLVKEEENGNKYLIAAVIPQRTFDKAHTLIYLRARLPEHMVPAVMLELETFPLNDNGKIDKKALAGQIQGPSSATEFTPPRSPLEATLAGIWQEILEVERIGVNDDFFQLGGHSLLAIKIVSRIRKKLHVEASVGDIFAYPMLSSLAKYLGEQQQEFQAPPITRQPHAALSPLSFNQERMWFLDQREGSLQYHVPIRLRIEGKPDVVSLEKAFQSLIARHEVLRSVVTLVEGRPWQRVTSGEWKLSIVEHITDEGALNDFVDTFANTPFDLQRDVMLRACVIKGAEKNYLVIVIHHMAFDGWSLPILFRELVEVYNATLTGRKITLPELPIQYADFAVWQRGTSGKSLETKLAYWKNKLQDVLPVNLALEFSGAPASRRGNAFFTVIDKRLAGRAQQRVREEDATLFMGLLAVLKILLYRYTGQADLCLGTVVANRSQTEIQGLIGQFINPVALRTDLRAAATFRDVLRLVKTAAQEAYAHQDVPFEKVVEAVARKRNGNSNPLFDILFSFDNVDSLPAKMDQLIGLELITESMPYHEASFDINFAITQREGGLLLRIDYRTDLFSEETIRNMSAHFTGLLKAVVDTPDGALATLNFMSDHERELLRTFNRTEVPFPADKTIVHLVEERAMATPAQIALVFDNVSYSYCDVQEQSNRVAAALVARGVTPESLVPVCMDRGADMIIAMIAVLKAGAGYVPVDRAHPVEWILQVIRDTGARVVIGGKPGLHATDSAFSFVEFASLLHGGDSSTVAAYPMAEQRAYVIYTSGTSGRPKGVMIEHRSLVNLVAWHNREYHVHADSRATVMAGVGFDAYGWEVWPYLAAGATLYGVDVESRLSPAAIVDVFQKNHITHSFISTALIPGFLVEAKGRSLRLKVLLTGGDKLPLLDFENLPYRLVNNYGLTEHTVVSTKYDVGGKPAGVPFIGTPIDNIKIHIVDANHQLVPIGVPGELLIEGAGIARGYLNESELTARKFIDNPVDPGGGKVFKTGDLGRWVASGNIEYLGRADEQVKVRGYRIELAEIESVMLQSTLISQGVVIVHAAHEDDRQLVAYIVPREAYSKEGLIGFLETWLPDYMVPSLFIPLDELPLTLNGKVDRKQLPEPQAQIAVSSTGPRNETEHALANIWKKVLDIDTVGVHDNFFELGGHSLLATKALAMIRSALKVDLSVADIFEYTTIAALAGQLRNQQVNADVPLVKVHDRPAQIPLTFGQERLWFIDQLEGSTQYHVPFVVRLTGAVDIAALEKAFRGIVARHEVLRTVIRQEQGQVFQHVLSSEGWKLVVDTRPGEAVSTEVIVAIIGKPFSLFEDYMLRVNLVGDAGEFVLVLTLHHIVADGLSIPIIIEELAELYNAMIEGRLPRIPASELQYADFALWQRRHMSSDRLQPMIENWKQRLEGLTALRLPTDRPRPAKLSNRGDVVRFEIDPQSFQEIQRVCRDQGVTLFMFFLATFDVLLYRYTGQRDVCIGSTVANRVQQETQRMVGFFVNTLPIRTILESSRFDEVLQRVREATLDAFANQDVPLEKIVEATLRERDGTRSPLFQVMFDMQSEVGTDLSPTLLKGLQVVEVDFTNPTARYDLRFVVEESSDRARVSFEYSADLFDQATLVRMKEHYQVMLYTILQEPARPITNLPLLLPAERMEIETVFNPSLADPTSLPANVLTLFNEQVRRHPDGVALLFEEHCMTYQELDTNSSKLARYLQNQGVSGDTPVPLFAERSMDMIVAILGILKAGAAYVPMDIKSPAKRIAAVLSDIGATHVVTTHRSKEKLPAWSGMIIDINEAEPQVRQESGATWDQTVSGDAAAYIIYTSGSSGRPKGVVITHQSLQLSTHARCVYYREVGRVLVVPSYTFDSSVAVFFGTLALGGTLVMCAEDDIKSVPAVAAALRRSDTILCVPSYYRFLLDEGLVQQAALLRVILAGEALDDNLVKQHFRSVPGTALYNEYGPTECAIWATVSTISPDDDRVTIGKPIETVRVYILDDCQNLLPQGVYGEICLAGGQVCREYLGDAALTAEKIIANPFATSSLDARLYRTGDVGRWLPDGRVEYLGRVDSQVKINGHRIELGEVERVLLQYPEVRQAAVAVRTDELGQKSLAAFLVPERGYEASGVQIFLKQTLPEYMLPSIIVSLDSFPLTENGKIDRVAMLKHASFENNGQYASPRTPTEALLVNIWQELLGVGRVGIYDDFFQLGGHSLLAIRVASAIRKQMKLEVSVDMLFEMTTIDTLGRWAAAQYAQKQTEVLE